VYQGKTHNTEAGVPQGTIISPLLSNIYLHELDEYINSEIIPNVSNIAKMTGKVPEGGRIYSSARRKASYQVEK